MTTPPKARQYRLSSAESVLSRARVGTATAKPAHGGVRVEVHKGAKSGGRPEAADQPMPFSVGANDDGFGDMRFPGASPTTGKPPQSGPATDQAVKAAGPGPIGDPIASIKAENLTQRQLRMAGRIAAMHEIAADSDYDAVVKLRERGIDPFHRDAVGRILSREGARAAAAPSPYAPATAPANLPARGRRQEIAPIGPTQLPSREEMTEDRRATEIFRIQRDIARRRRRRLAMLLGRLMVFVFIPTIVAGWYYFSLATPLYATKSQFLIQQASASGGGGGGLGGLLSGTSLATNTDSVSVQNFLTSRDAMLRLNEELGFKRTYQDPTLDPILRLPSDASNEEAYKLYQRFVKIGYDPTEGVIDMEVVAPSPQLSEAFSLALIRYAEGQVDQMTSRLREDQMQGALETYNDAEGKVQDAQKRVQALQERMGVLDPMAEGSVVMAQVGQLEGELTKKRLELGQLESNARPNQSRVQGVKGDIDRLEQMVADTRAQLTEDTGKRVSLASVSGEIRIAESDLLTRQQLLAAAAAQMESARIEANKQVRYLSLSVVPVPPDQPTYPRAFQNTLVAFLIFAGIYLMMSLTASILREQVST